MSVSLRNHSSDARRTGGQSTTPQQITYLISQRLASVHLIQFNIGCDFNERANKRIKIVEDALERAWEHLDALGEKDGMDEAE